MGVYIFYFIIEFGIEYKKGCGEWGVFVSF